MVFEALQHTLQMEKEFCSFKARESSKDFKIALEVIFFETSILDVWLGSENASVLWQQNTTKLGFSKDRYKTYYKPISM